MVLAGYKYLLYDGWWMKMVILVVSAWRTQECLLKRVGQDLAREGPAEVTVMTAPSPGASDVVR